MSISAHATAAIRFRVAGPVRFLSHAETLRVLQRACARAALPVRYTEGFNPHPRLSLPLPRPVGVEADEELLVARVQDAGPIEDRPRREAAIGQALAGELPEGMEVLGVALSASNASFHPRCAEYVLPVGGADDPQRRAALQDAITRVMDSPSCMVERASPGRKAPRRINVRGFLGSIRLEKANLIVQHRTGASGSIRVEEILELFGWQRQDLAGPVRRTNVTWEATQFENAIQRNGLKARAEDTQDGT